MEGKLEFSPKSPKMVRLDLSSLPAVEPALSVDTPTSPLRQSLQLHTEMSPLKSGSNLKQSFYRPLTPKSSATSPALLSSASYRSPAKQISRRRSSLKCESLEDNSKDSRPSRAGSLVRNKSFTYGHSWAGSDSDLSQLSSLNINNTFQYMNTMQQSLGVMLTASPLVMLIASLKTNTRDSFDGNLRAASVNITASLENINISLSYKRDFNKTTAEVGEIHLDLLSKACREQIDAIVYELLQYHLDADNVLSEENMAAHDQNNNRLTQSAASSRVQSYDDRHPVPTPPPPPSSAEPVEIKSLVTEEPSKNVSEVEENLEPAKILKTASHDSDFSLNFDNGNQQIYDTSSESTVNNNFSRHPSQRINYTPPISNAPSSDFGDDHHITPQRQPFVDLPPPPPDTNEVNEHFATGSNSSHLPPPYRNKSRSLSQPNGISDPLYSEVDIGIHEYSTIIFRFLDLACTNSEILQVQGNVDQAIVDLLKSFYYVNLFVNKYLSDWETLLLFASLDDEENYHPDCHFDEKVLSGVDSVFSNLCVEKKINWHNDNFVVAMMSSNGSDKSNQSFDLNLVMNLENLCRVLAKYDTAHTLYGIGHGIRRLSVLLKCTGRYNYAFLAVQACIHIFQTISELYDTSTMYLSACYALGASILEEMSSFEESIEMDKKALELSAVVK